MIVLGIETSCDETAVALVDDTRRVLAHRVLSQLDEHRLYGGVVPEIAARAHLDHLDSLVVGTMGDANVTLAQMDGIAATCGPGLIGGVMVGAMMGKALALVTGKPFLAVNHLEAHALTARLTHNTPFPFLLLLISGGHCQLLAVEGLGKYKLYGRTIDDAVGEAFDKVAKLMSLGFPGGPAVERTAQNGNATRFELPQPMIGKPNCDFSFSGLKTAVRHLYLSLKDPTDQDRADIAATFQQVVAHCLADRTHRAIDRFRSDYGEGHALVVAGGVAANQTLRSVLQKCAHKHEMELVVPPPSLCTDNGAMVAWAGLEKLKAGQVDDLSFAPRPRWPLGEDLRTRT